jgi:hypothetical protein
LRAGRRQIYAGDEVTVPLSFIVDGDGVVTDLLPGWSDESRRRLEALAGERREANGPAPAGGRECRVTEAR